MAAADHFGNSELDNLVIDVPDLPEVNVCSLLLAVSCYILTAPN